MENKAAKELWKKPIGEKGSFTKESITATDPSLVTTAERTFLTTKYQGTQLQFFQTTSSSADGSEEGEASAVVTETLVWQDEFRRKRGFTGYIAQKNTFIRKCQQKTGNGLNAWYLYKTSPVLDGQEPSLILPKSDLNFTGLELEESVETSSETPTDEPAKGGISESDTLDDLCQLYMYARFLPVKGIAGTTSYVIYSTAKGMDPDARESGGGFVWKDVYKIIRIPQFQYAALIMDITDFSNKIVGKSQQKSTIDLRPTFELAAGVDLAAVVTATVPLLPEGSTKVWQSASLANEFSGMLTSAT